MLSAAGGTGGSLGRVALHTGTKNSPPEPRRAGAPTGSALPSPRSPVPAGRAPLTGELLPPPAGQPGPRRRHGRQPRRRCTRAVAGQPGGGESRDGMTRACGTRRPVRGRRRSEAAGGPGAAPRPARGSAGRGPFPHGVRAAAQIPLRCCRPARLRSPASPATSPRAAAVSPPGWLLCCTPRAGRCGLGGRRQQLLGSSGGRAACCWLGRRRRRERRRRVTGVRGLGCAGTERTNRGVSCSRGFPWPGGGL